MPEDQGNKQVEEIQPSGVPTENQTPEANDGIELPEDTSERTKAQFQKLIEHNKKLAEENRQLKEVKLPEDPNGFDFDPLPKPKVELPKIPGLEQELKDQINQTEDEIEKLVDKDGYIDDKLLKLKLQKLDEATKRANEMAERAIRIQEQTIKDRENDTIKKLYQKYPQLNPNNKEIFNPKFYELVKDKALSQMVKNGKRDISKAVEDAADVMSINPQSKTEQPKENKEAKVELINQTGAASNRIEPAYKKADNDYLSKRTMAGDQNALLERLRRAGL